MKIVLSLLAAILLLALPLAAQTDCPCDVTIRTGSPGPIPPGVAPTPLPPGVDHNPYVEITILPHGTTPLGDHITLNGLKDLNIAATDLPKDAVLRSFTIKIFSKRGRQLFQATRRLPKSAQEQRAFMLDAQTARSGARYFVPGNTVLITVQVAFEGGTIKVTSGKTQ